MSQPPPPPGQPPSGGFGAPQEPPPGGPSYGYPQQPPQQPGQPPQAPGAPPSTPPPPNTPPPPGGYGYPQQPPPGYGYPQQPPQPGGFTAPPPPGAPQGSPQGQPPYGYPQQPPGQYPQQHPGMYGTPPPGAPGGPGGKNNGKIIGIVAAVVAVVLIAGAGVFFLTKDGDEKDDEAKGGGGNSQGVGGKEAQPKNAKAEELFTLDAPKVNDVTTVIGAWATDSVYAKSSVNEIQLMDLKTNKKKGTIALKGGVCSATTEMTKDHKVGLVVQETISSKADCSRMVVVDLDAAKIVMDEKMPNADTIGNENVVLSGTTVASAWIGGSAAYDIRTGKKLWAAKASTCRDKGYKGGKHLYAVVECGDLDTPQITVQRLDPANKGKATWKYEVPKGATNVRIASVDPLVLVTGTGSDSLTTDVMAISEDKKLKARIPLGKRYEKPCGLEVNACYSIAAADDTIFLATTEHQGSSDYGRTNEVMAFDFESGHPKWKAPAGEKRTMFPIRMEGRNVLAYKQPSYDSGGEIVSIEPSKGKQTKLLKMPVSDFGKGEQAFSVSASSLDTPVLYEHGRFFLDDHMISERRPSDEEIPKLAVGFGPK